MMELQQIDDRLEKLSWALQYCAENTKTFTTGERICINQERASLLEQRSAICGLTTKYRNYKVNDSIEYRIQLTMNRIKKNPYFYPNHSNFLQNE